MNFYKDKKVLVTGGTGLIGKPLVDMLVNYGANVTIASLDDPSLAPTNTKFLRTDLREFNNCLAACKEQEIVFHLAGIKGSPAMCAQKPASFFVPTITFSINMMEAARRCGVKQYLFTSSIGVYAPSEIFYEDAVWQTFPSPNDRFAGWAKRMGELQAQAYKIEHNWNEIAIVRPANVYGPYDNFDPNNAMVIPSLINHAFAGENPLTVWGDGSPIRDFIYAEDVARSMLLIIEKGIYEPINLGSGTEVSIKKIAEIIAANAPNGPIEIKWDTSKPSGDKKRLMDITRSTMHSITPTVSIKEGIIRTINWYVKNKNIINKKYNSFIEFNN